MARSNTGGTRGFLRGRVANDLYQVTKNKAGKKIQLVRAVEQSRINNNTILQAGARMMMALLMGCLKQFKAIVDHSFESIPYGQLSIAHFVEVNMKLVQEDCRIHWDGGNIFDYPIKGEPLLRIGSFIMAEGSLTLPSVLQFTMVDAIDNIAGLKISLGMSNPRFSDLKSKLGAAANDYITMLLFQYDSYGRENNTFLYSRCYLSDRTDDPVITSDNVEAMFTYDGNCNRFVTFDSQSGAITIAMQKVGRYWDGEIVASCIILSVWDGVKWRRNNAQFTNVDPQEPWRDLMSPNDVFSTWYGDYSPDASFNPYA